MMQIYIPRFGNYFHFLTESVFQLYKLLKDQNKLETLDCEIWYKGGYKHILQMMSCRPVREISDVSEVPSTALTLKHQTLKTPDEFKEFLEVVNFLQNKVPPSPKDSHITLIKRNSKYRVFTDHDELAVKLGNIGKLRVVSLETLSYPEEINLMRNTSILISPHGSGTANLVYMPPGAVTIELFPMGFIYPHGNTLSRISNHEYHRVLSVKPGVVGRPYPVWYKDLIARDSFWNTLPGIVRLCKMNKEFMRATRDVASFSIPVQRILYLVREIEKRKRI